MTLSQEIEKLCSEYLPLEKQQELSSILYGTAADEIMLDKNVLISVSQAEQAFDDLVIIRKILSQ